MIDLYDGEKILVCMRKHWLPFALEASGFILAAIFPIILYFLFTIFSPEIVDGFSTSILVFSLASWLLFLWLIFLVFFTSYYLDQIIVTSRRVVDVNQLSLFARDIATMPIEQLQDIRVDILGILGTFFKYGTLNIQSAGAHKEMVIRWVRDPEVLKGIILSCHNTQRHGQTKE